MAGKSRAAQALELGQSVWIDFLSRDMLTTGEPRPDDEARTPSSASRPTRRSSRRRSSAGDAYDEQLARLLAESDDPKEIFLRLAVQDVTATPATCCAPCGTQGDGKDGYVSLEVDPELAYDTEGTTARGRPPARAGRPAEPLRQDPGDRRRACRDRGLDRRRARRSTSR